MTLSDVGVKHGRSDLIALALKEILPRNDMLNAWCGGVSSNDPALWKRGRFARANFAQPLRGLARPHCVVGETTEKSNGRAGGIRCVFTATLTLAYEGYQDELRDDEPSILALSENVTEFLRHPDQAGLVVPNTGDKRLVDNVDEIELYNAENWEERPNAVEHYAVITVRYQHDRPLGQEPPVWSLS